MNFYFVRNRTSWNTLIEATNDCFWLKNHFVSSGTHEKKFEISWRVSGGSITPLCVKPSYYGKEKIQFFSDLIRSSSRDSVAPNRIKGEISDFPSSLIFECSPLTPSAESQSTLPDSLIFQNFPFWVDRLHGYLEAVCRSLFCSLQIKETGASQTRICCCYKRQWC